VIGVRGPAVSPDGGKSWNWLGSGAVEGNAFRYRFPAEAADVRFAMTIPYLAADLNAFVRRFADNPSLKLETHCQTKKGRPVERLRLGRLDGPPEHRALLTCRHHACESMASFALEGLMEEVLAGKDDGPWLRQHVEFLAVPFVDKDGVEDGDQGKNRRPHDHNRDYLEPSIYASVAALREFAPKWSDGRLRIALDLHCPSIRGGGNEQLVFVGNRDPQIWQRQQQFAAVLKEVQTGPLVYDPKHNIPYGTGWNNLPLAKSCSAWAGQLPGVLWAGTFELPYANAGGKPVTQDSARAFGRDLARALRRYLETPSRPEVTSSG
jgi:hypothetical protein